MKKTALEDVRRRVRERFPFPEYMDGYLDSYYSIASTVAKYLSSGAAVLDFGSGPCDKTAIVQELGYRCSACDTLNDEWHRVGDNRERIVEFATTMGIDFRLTSAAELPFARESFDMVMCHHVLEHFHDSPKATLNDLVSLLKPNGILFVTVPNAANIRKRLSLLIGRTNLPPFDSYYWSDGRWTGHVREYVQDDLKRLSDYLGLDIVELNGVHHMLNVLPKTVRPAYVLVTSLFPGWRDSWLLVARKPSTWTARNEPSEKQLAALARRQNPYMRRLAERDASLRS